MSCRLALNDHKSDWFWRVYRFHLGLYRFVKAVLNILPNFNFCSAEFIFIHRFVKAVLNILPNFNFCSAEFIFIHVQKLFKYLFITWCIAQTVYLIYWLLRRRMSRCMCFSIHKTFDISILFSYQYFNLNIITLNLWS